MIEKRKEMHRKAKQRQLDHLKKISDARRAKAEADEGSKERVKQLRGKLKQQMLSLSEKRKTDSEFGTIAR